MKTALTSGCLALTVLLVILAIALVVFIIGLVVTADPFTAGLDLVCPDCPPVPEGVLP